jgi:paraquat-inducible protein B
MNTETPKSKILSVALFFVLMIAILLTSLYVTGGLKGLFDKTDTVHVAFHESVTGLRPGSPVTLSGVNVGRVTSIRPMTSSEARELVRSSKIVIPKGESAPTDAAGSILSGERFLSTHHPLVLATLKTDVNAIPRNERTSVSLITTDFTASQAVRFSAGSDKNRSDLDGHPVVFSAGESPLSRLRSRFLDPREGVLRKQNVQNINALIKNLKQVSKQLGKITDRNTKRKIDRLLSSHMDIAQRLNSWLEVKPNCPDSKKPLQVTRFQDGGKTKYRLKCPGSDRMWVRDHPPKTGRVAMVFDRMNTLLDRLNQLTTRSDDSASIPVLVDKVSRLSDNLNRTSRTMTAVIQENRSRIRALLNNVNELSQKMDAVLTQLDQDPSSAVFGRRGPEIRSPYGE